MPPTNKPAQSPDQTPSAAPLPAEGVVVSPLDSLGRIVVKFGDRRQVYPKSAAVTLNGKTVEANLIQAGDRVRGGENVTELHVTR